MKIKKLIPFLSVLCLSLIVFMACKENVVVNNDVPIGNIVNPDPKPKPPLVGPGIDAPDATNPYLLQIATGYVGKGGKFGEMEPIKDFKPETLGPYFVEKAPVTSRLALEIKTKAPKGAVVEVENTSVVNIPAMVDFFEKEGVYQTGAIRLTCGENIISIKVTSPDGKNKIAYSFKVNYKEPETSAANPRVYEGLFCPDLGKHDFFWVIVGKGTCLPCSTSLEAAQSLYEKFKDKGLKVIAITPDSTDNKEWKDKLKKAGILYNSYTIDNDNPLIAKIEYSQGLPVCAFFKEGKKVHQESGPRSISGYAQLLRDLFGIK